MKKLPKLYKNEKSNPIDNNKKVCYLKEESSPQLKVEETLKAYSHLFLSTLNEIVDVIDNLEDNQTDD